MHIHSTFALQITGSILDRTTGAATKREIVRADVLPVGELERFTAQDDFFQLLLVFGLRVVLSLKVLLVLGIQTLMQAVLECKILVVANAQGNEGIEETCHSTYRCERLIKGLDGVLVAQNLIILNNV